MAKVGFLYTISLLIMALTVLSLALLIAEIEQESNEQIADIAKYDRLYDLDSSINNAFVEVFKTASGISLKYNNTNGTLFIRETLPNANNTIFSRNMTNLRKYLNKTANHPVDNITLYARNLDEVNKSLAFQILPYNLTYTHTKAFGSFTIRVNNNTPYNFYGYNITVISSVDIFTAPTWRPSAPATGFNKNMILKIKVRGPSVGNFFTYDKRIDSTALPVHLRIRDLANTQNIINISISKSSMFVNNTLPANKLIVTTGIILKPARNHSISIQYPKKIYNVTLKDFNIKTVSNVLLYSFPS